MSAPLSSVMSVIPLRLLESSMAQSLERRSCWYCRAGSWMAWMSMLESTSFPTLCQDGEQVMRHQPREDQAGDLKRQNPHVHTQLKCSLCQVKFSNFLLFPRQLFFSQSGH